MKKKNHRKSFSCKYDFSLVYMFLFLICNFIICDQRKILSLSSGLSLKCAHFNVAMLSVFKESVYYLFKKKKRLYEELIIAFWNWTRIHDKKNKKKKKNCYACVHLCVRFNACVYDEIKKKQKKMCVNLA